MWRYATKGRARGEPIGGGDRQPERQGSAKRGASFDPQGFDAGKKVTGRKRHILVDTLGLLLSVIVHPADVQDRDGARELLRTARRSFPFIETIFADGGYQGPRMAATVATTGCWKLEIVKRPRPASHVSRSVISRRQRLVGADANCLAQTCRSGATVQRHRSTAVAFER